uniref:Stabilin 2 n=1 Tax=Pavo cristatus TaxID=9049 RepID=A0A8C9EHP5_PAVCR
PGVASCSPGSKGGGISKSNPSLHLVCSCVHGVCNSGITGDGRCTCLSGYQGLSCDQPIAECKALRCPANSRCTTSGEDGRRLQCTCLPNYHGVGTQCEPINPCFTEVCDPNANCTYLGPNRHKCTCREGYRGDGQVCLPIDPCQALYGNCPAQSTICIYDGPGKSHCECKEHYTSFVPGKGCSMTDICETNNTCHKRAKCSVIAPGQITCTCQRGSVGNGFVCYGNIMERLQDLNTEAGGRWQGKLTSALIKELLNNNLKAQYFVKLHVIAGQLNTTSLNNTDIIYTLTGKSGEVSRGEKVETCMYCSHRNRPYTVFVPSNDALSNMKAEDLDYLLSAEGSLKLLELVRYHTVSNAEVSRIVSQGQVLVSGEEMEETDIVAKNGRIFTLAGVLIPPTIVPILPHRCDETKSQIAMGVCASCFSHAFSPCPPDSKPIVSRTVCLILQEPRCCRGFFGPNCSPCPGGFSKPCSGNGQVIRASNPILLSLSFGEDGVCPKTEVDQQRRGSLAELLPARFACSCLYGDDFFCPLPSPQAECIQTGPGGHVCACQAGWTGDGWDCSAINNCLLPSVAGCHENATCIYIGPGQNDCKCKDGFRGNGIECTPINSCLEQNGKCHHLVSNKSFFEQSVQIRITPHLLSQTTRKPWPPWCQTLPSLLLSFQNLTVEGAHIVTGDIASTNGIIHVIDKVLTPLRSTIMPRLLARLEQMPDYSIFRGYIIQYGLANEIEAANTYTVFAPNNDAIENYLRDKKVATLDEDQIRYHILIDEKLLKNDLHNGMHRETMLGYSYNVGFFLHNSQLFVNDAPISYANVATDKGIIHGLGKVLEIQKNRCDTNHTVITVSGSVCIDSQRPIRDIFREKKYCIFSENNMRLYTIQIGCQPKCAKTIITKECCAGFFGQQCQPCPGKAGSACFGNGICLDGINGSGICQCGSGFVGTACESCAEGKYGRNCDQVCACVHGKCSSGIDGDGSCECNVGWRGVTCESGECPPCFLGKNCLLLSNDTAYCKCAAGFTGNGTFCTAIDACEISNGGCSANAECRKTTPGNRVCVCKAGYTGDGVVCLGKHSQCLMYHSRKITGVSFPVHGRRSVFCYDPEVQFLGTRDHGDKDIAGPGPFTVFVPHTNVLNSDQRVSKKVRGWLAKGVMAQILRYHMVGCASLLHSDLTTLTNVTSLHGDRIQISYAQKNKLLGLINDPIHKPVTLFWPTDAAIRRLPQEQQDFLFKKSNTDKLVQYLKFHIVRNAEILAYQLPHSTLLKTLQGSNLSISCGDNTEIGTLFLNDRQCKIVQRQLEFDGGIAYGIDCLLMDPSLGGRCDSFFTVDIMGYCASCFSGAKCPPGTKPKEGIYRCTYDSYGLRRDGCRRNCSMVIHTAKCCKGYFGPDCQACPGGPETPCNSHGYCDDGYAGTGECHCYSGFNGTSCELCLPGRYGSSCRPCECQNNGQCEEGYSGTGRCFCETGWTGRCFAFPTALPPVCTPSCSANAVCMENNTCQCKPLYNGDGITCTAADLCKQNNGGCHKAANCTQLGVKIFCNCQKGYKGDGFTCLPINPCADGFNGGCHEHAICTVIGPDKRKCDCKNNYIGDGLNCSVMQLPLDRCLQDNGQCHPDADCTDLHFQDTTVGVFHLRSPQGQYKMTYEKAKEACANESATIATYNQLLYAQKARYHLCAASWLDGQRVGYPTAFSSPNCGAGYVGIVDYGRRVNLSETWDVFCYREKGENGHLSLTAKGSSSPILSTFGSQKQGDPKLPRKRHWLTQLSVFVHSRGKAFLQYLTDLSVHATLFAPNDSGLRENQTLSGRDIEYHLSNASIMFYEDLTNGTTLLTRLGEKLLITDNGGKEYQTETRYVDASAIVEWDIVASNGIIHVISEPLRAPPVPAHLHAGTGTGIFFGICLVIGVVAFIGYSYLRFRKKSTGFQHFKSKDDTDVTSLDKPQPSNITNPSYESSSALTPSEPTYDLFSVSVKFYLGHN